MTRILVLVRMIFTSPPSPPFQVKPSLQSSPVARLEVLGIVYRLRA